jgi:hypothetical protein
MDFEFEKPNSEDAPKTIGKPWTVKLEYRSGKTPEAYVDQATPEKAKAGFTYYRPESGEKGYLGPFKCALLGVYSGVSGAIPNGTRFDNYWSNFVKDTRTDIIRVQLGSKENAVTIAEGIYNDFKHTLPTGVSYTKFAIVYIFATQEVATLELSASLELALKEAIAAETGKKPHQINLFNLFELVNRFWGFAFTGRFTARQKDGLNWDGKGEMYYYPELKTGIVTSDNFPQLPAITQDISDYIDSFSKGKRMNEAAGTANDPGKEYQEAETASAPAPQPLPEPNAHMAEAKKVMATAGFVEDPTFPTVNVTSHNEVGSDDLPF